MLFFLFFREGKGERERNINVWLPLMCPLLETWPARALTRNPAGNPFIHRLALSPLSHSSQGSTFIFEMMKSVLFDFLKWDFKCHLASAKSIGERRHFTTSANLHFFHSYLFVHQQTLIRTSCMCEVLCQCYSFKDLKKRT